MDNVQYAGQFNIDEVKIFSSSGTVIDITKLVVAMNLYEDVYKTAVTGTIAVSDTNNIIMEAPIIGQEFIGFKISTPGLDKFALDYSEHVFTITKVLARASSNPGAQAYSFYFCSPEGLRDTRVRVSKSYTNSLDAIVEDILTAPQYINSKKTFFIEPTKGIRRITVPYIHPFKFINHLKQDAISAKHDSPHYMFYENTLGYHFRSLDSLFAQKAIATFHTGDKGSIEDIDKDPRNIEEEYKRVMQFQVSGNSDMLQNVVTGMLASNIITHDIFRKEYRVDDFEYFNDFFDNYRINYDETKKDNPIYNEAPIDEFDNDVSMFTDARRYVHPTSTTENNIDAQHYEKFPAIAGVIQRNTFTANNIPKTIMSRQSKLAELTKGVSVTIEVHGTTTLHVGAIVNFSAPVVGAQHSGEKFDKYLSGRYMIKTLKHTFDFSERRHLCAMTLVKDSFNTKLPMHDLAIEPKAEARGILSEFYS